MARQVEVQGSTIHACEQCDFAYKDAATADECASFDLQHGMRSFALTKKAIAPPHRHYQAVMKFIDEEAKAAKAKEAAAKKAAEAGVAPKPAAAPAAGAPPAAPAAAPAAAAPRPQLSPEELEARKKAALEKAAAAKAAKEQAQV